MSETCVRNAAENLPTLQRNALCMLLGRRQFEPADIAAIAYPKLERAPRIGAKGIAVIRAWLRPYGLDISDLPQASTPGTEFHRQRRLAKAIAVIRQNGYGVVIPEDAG